MVPFCWCLIPIGLDEEKKMKHAVFEVLQFFFPFPCIQPTFQVAFSLEPCSVY